MTNRLDVEETRTEIHPGSTVSQTSSMSNDVERAWEATVDSLLSSVLPSFRRSRGGQKGPSLLGCPPTAPLWQTTDTPRQAQNRQQRTESEFTAPSLFGFYCNP